MNYTTLYISISNWVQSLAVSTALFSWVLCLCWNSYLYYLVRLDSAQLWRNQFVETFRYHSNGFCFCTTLWYTFYQVWHNYYFSRFLHILAFVVVSVWVRQTVGENCISSYGCGRIVHFLETFFCYDIFCFLC